MIKIKGLRKNYGKGEGVVQALRGVSLDIDKGEFACVWGASGSGKSTLLNMIGLIDVPDEGEIVFDGQDMLSLREDALAQYRSEKIGFVFQAFNLVPVLNAVENVMIPLQVSGMKTTEAEKKAQDILAEVGLADKFNKRPDEMSGGQKQRVAIARALVGNPELILADEPTANLDSVTSESIISLMKEINSTRNVTFIFSTHDPKLIDYASRNIYLSDGQILQSENETINQIHVA